MWLTSGSPASFCVTTGCKLCIEFFVVAVSVAMLHRKKKVLRFCVIGQMFKYWCED